MGEAQELLSPSSIGAASASYSLPPSPRFPSCLGAPPSSSRSEADTSWVAVGLHEAETPVAPVPLDPPAAAPHVAAFSGNSPVPPIMRRLPMIAHMSRPAPLNAPKRPRTKKTADQQPGTRRAGAPRDLRARETTRLSAHILARRAGGGDRLRQRQSTITGTGRVVAFAVGHPCQIGRQSPRNELLAQAACRVRGNRWNREEGRMLNEAGGGKQANEAGGGKQADEAGK